jgi:hypothetical protein
LDTPSWPLPRFKLSGALVRVCGPVRRRFLGPVRPWFVERDRPAKRPAGVETGRTRAGASSCSLVRRSTGVSSEPRSAGTPPHSLVSSLTGVSKEQTRAGTPPRSLVHRMTGVSTPDPRAGTPPRSPAAGTRCAPRFARSARSPAVLTSSGRRGARGPFPSPPGHAVPRPVVVARPTADAPLRIRTTARGPLLTTTVGQPVVTCTRAG